MALLHSEPGVPQGRGKIERWFATVRSQFLPLLGERLTLEELNTRLVRWIDTEYHQRTHASTRKTPLERYLAALHAVRPAPKDIWEHFRIPLNRKVDRDRTVSINGTLFEAPVGLVGEKVTLLYHEHDPKRVELFFAGRSYGFLTPLDLAVNARVRREAKQRAELVDQEPAGDAPQSYRGGSLFTDRNGEAEKHGGVQ